MYEVVEIQKNTWNDDWSSAINNRWVCDDENDAILQLAVRKVEAEMLGRTDAYFEAREDGEPMERRDDPPEDDEVCGALLSMGYSEAEILAVFG
jgi:hypothetical protein